MAAGASGGGFDGAANAALAGPGAGCGRFPDRAEVMTRRPEPVAANGAASGYN